MKGQREKGLPADYGGATPEEVARAVLRYRPGKKKQRPARKREQAEGRDTDTCEEYAK